MSHKKAPSIRGGIDGAGSGDLGRNPRSEICSRGWERSGTGVAPVADYMTTPYIDGS